jgi:hypothetical protein
MKKLALVALAAVTMFGAVAATSKDAEARRWHRGAGIGLGIFAAGALIHAASGPRYVRQCGYVARYNAYGEYRGTRRVCHLAAY